MTTLNVPEINSLKQYRIEINSMTLETVWNRKNEVNERVEACFSNDFLICS